MKSKRYNFWSQHENIVALIICLSCGAIMAFSLLKGQMMSGDSIVLISEEHYQIGYEYYSTGKLSLFSHPSLFRAPGYPTFIAIALNGRDLFVSALSLAGLAIQVPFLKDYYWVISLQLLLLMIGAFIFYKSLRLWIPKFPASALLAAYIINPLSHSAVRSLSYGILDFFFITAVIFLCCLYVYRDLRLQHFILWGFVLSLATLVRPVFLTTPLLFLAVSLFAKGISFRTTLRSVALLGVLIGVFLSPYLVRNYLVSGNFVPVTNQGPWAFWGNSVTVLLRREAFTEVWSPWREKVWDPFGAKEFVEVTGVEYSERVLYAYSEQLSKHFSGEFLVNLRTQAAIYLKNVAGNSIFYLFAPRLYPERLFWALYSPDLNTASSLLKHIFSVLNVVATVISIPVLIYSASKSKLAKLGLILIGYFALNYSIVFLDSRYLYSLQPVVWFSVGISLTELAKQKGLTPTQIVLTTGFATSLFFFGQALPIFYTLVL